MDIAVLSQTEFLRPLVTAWLGKIEKAKDARKSWMEEAEDCQLFFAGATGFMWDERYRSRFGLSGVAPKFRMTMNKAFEFVAIKGPELFFRVPHRSVKPIDYRSPVAPEALFPPEQPQQGPDGQPIPTQAQQFMQWLQGEDARELSTNRMVAGLMEGWMNFTPREMPGGGLCSQSQMAIQDGLITGRGVLMARPYRKPGSQLTVSALVRENPKNIVGDPDFHSHHDWKWMARQVIEPYWEAERKFGLPAGTLKGKASLESEWTIQERNSEWSNHPNRKGTTNDLVVYYEIWSRMGVGTRMSGVSLQTIGPHLEQVVGDYAYLAVSPSLPYPLNAPVDLLRNGATDDEVRSRFQWPIETWRAGRWPIECHDEQTEVLTDRGWKFFSELTGEENLGTVNLNTDTIEFQRPSKLTRKKCESDMIRFCGRQKLDAYVTAGHRMVAYAAHSNSPVFKRADEILRSDQVKMVAANWAGAAPVLPEFVGNMNAADFAEWIGFYIAEGCCTNQRTNKGGRTLKWRVSVSQKKADGRIYYENLATKLPLHSHPYESGNYNITNKKLWQYLRPYGSSAHTKSVPQWIKDAPQEVISAFLRGYIAGDGHVSKKTGQTVSVTVSKQLADDLQELWMKVGKSATIRTKPPKPYCFIENGIERRGMSGQQYVVGVRKRTKASLRDPKKGELLFLRESGYTGMVYCATVPNGTLITRRNGKTLISGNCLDFYPHPERAYPIPPISPGMGELKFINVFISHLCNRIWSSSRDFLACNSAIFKEIEKYMQQGGDLTILPIPPMVNNINEMLTWLTQPQVNLDAWKIIEAMSVAFDRRVGLTAYDYSDNPGGNQIRTAEDAANKRTAAGVRPKYMQECVTEFVTKASSLEAICARTFITGNDVRACMGNTRAQLWDQFVLAKDPGQIAHEFQYTVAASDMRPPDKDRDAANVQQAMGIMAPELSKHADITGDTTPLNNLWQMWGKISDQDVSPMAMGQRSPPPPPPEAQQQQQAMMELEQQKVQAELMKVQLETQKMQVGAQLEAQSAQLDMAVSQAKAQSDQQQAAMKLQTEAQSAQMDAAVKVAEMQFDALTSKQEMMQDRAKFQQEMVQDEAQFQRESRQSEQQFEQQTKQQERMAKVKEKQAAKPKPKPKKGSK